MLIKYVTNRKKICHLIFFVFSGNFYNTIHLTNTEEEKSHQGKMNTPTPEADLVVELNSDILKTIHSLQVELQSFRGDILNETKEQQAINEALLRNMTKGIPQGKPTQSTNNSKI